MKSSWKFSAKVFAVLTLFSFASFADTSAPPEKTAVSRSNCSIADAELTPSEALRNWWSNYWQRDIGFTWDERKCASENLTVFAQKYGSASIKTIRDDVRYTLSPEGMMFLPGPGPIGVVEGEGQVAMKGWLARFLGRFRGPVGREALTLKSPVRIGQTTLPLREWLGQELTQMVRRYPKLLPYWDTLRKFDDWHQDEVIGRWWTASAASDLGLMRIQYYPANGGQMIVKIASWADGHTWSPRDVMPEMIALMEHTANRIRTETGNPFLVNVHVRGPSLDGVSGNWLLFKLPPTKDGMRFLSLVRDDVNITPKALQRGAEKFRPFCQTLDPIAGANIRLPTIPVNPTILTTVAVPR